MGSLEMLAKAWDRLTKFEKLKICFFVVLSTTRLNNKLWHYTDARNYLVIVIDSVGNILDHSQVYDEDHIGEEIARVLKKTGDIAELIPQHVAASCFKAARRDRWQNMECVVVLGKREFNSIIKYKAMDKSQMGLVIVPDYHLK